VTAKRLAELTAKAQVSYPNAAVGLSRDDGIELAEEVARLQALVGSIACIAAAVIT
jgi:hypothetical protein